MERVIQVNLSHIPTDALLEELDERLGGDLEEKGLALIMARMKKDKFSGYMFEDLKNVTSRDDDAEQIAQDFRSKRLLVVSKI